MPKPAIDRHAVDRLVDEIIDVTSIGVEVAIMVGGGNIFRGRLADDWGIERAEADNIGMMATIVNSLILRSALSSRGSHEVRVMTAIPIATVAEPYIRLRAIKHLEKGYIVIFAAGIGQPFVTTDYPAVQRAIEVRADAIFAAKQGVGGVFTADPKRCPDARRYAEITPDDVVGLGFRSWTSPLSSWPGTTASPSTSWMSPNAARCAVVLEGNPTGTYIGPDAVTRLADGALLSR